MRLTNLYTTIVLLFGKIKAFMGFGPLKTDALLEGSENISYRALDPVWQDKSSGTGGMILLQEHIKRLHTVANEMLYRGESDKWQIVSEHLSLAASLLDLSVDTDIYNTGMWCRPAAEFDEANCEVAAKYVASVSVFNLVWTAYEATVIAASEGIDVNLPESKGARGRELLKKDMVDKHFPCLRQVVFSAIELRQGFEIDYGSKGMRCLIKKGYIAAIGAEHLRCFRNAVVHGEIRQPMPDDWGELSKYIADNDPALRQFHFNIRITLLLIQILMRKTLRVDYELAGWTSNSQSGSLLLTQLHCESLHGDQLDLPFQDAPLIEDENDW